MIDAGNEIARTRPSSEISSIADPRQGDLFALGRTAMAMTHRLHAGRGVFARSKQLLGTGVWRGPRDAADAFVEEEDLHALRGLDAAIRAGIRTLVASSSTDLVREAAASGIRCLWRVPYRAAEPAGDRTRRLEALVALVQDGLPIDGVIPTPHSEPLGLDTVTLFAQCRLRLGVSHVVADFTRIGPRLAQMALGFGADELFGPIMPERALRLGDNANNPVMTRNEAGMMIRGAGLVPFERISGGTLNEFVP